MLLTITLAGITIASQLFGMRKTYCYTSIRANEFDRQDSCFHSVV